MQDLKNQPTKPLKKKEEKKAGKETESQKSNTSFVFFSFSHPLSLIISSHLISCHDKTHHVGYIPSK